MFKLVTKFIWLIYIFIHKYKMKTSRGLDLESVSDEKGRIYEKLNSWLR